MERFSWSMSSSKGQCVHGTWRKQGRNAADCRSNQLHFPTTFHYLVSVLAKKMLASLQDSFQLHIFLSKLPLSISGFLFLKLLGKLPCSTRGQQGRSTTGASACQLPQLHEPQSIKSAIKVTHCYLRSWWERKEVCRGDWDQFIAMLLVNNSLYSWLCHALSVYSHSHICFLMRERLRIGC